MARISDCLEGAVFAVSLFEKAATLHDHFNPDRSLRLLCDIVGKPSGSPILGLSIGNVE